LAVRSRNRSLIRAAIRFEREHKRFYNHMALSEIRALIPPARLAPLKSFTIERHPYEKVISLAYWLRRRRQDQELRALINHVIETRNYLNFAQYTIDGAVAVDRVLRYERLRDDLRDFLGELGLQPPADLPNAKARFRTSRVPAAEILSESQKERIRADARFEFAQFGYEP
jgi:hypothetical protein